MKKNILSILMLAVAMFCHADLNAQVRFGIRAAVNATKANISGNWKDNLTAEGRPGFLVGPTIEIGLPLGLGVDGAILYENKNVYLTNGNSTSASGSLHYIDIPINARFTLGFGKSFGVFVATGPQYSWNISGSFKEFAKEDHTFKNSLFSWNVGAGVNFSRHIRLGYTYNIGIGNTAEITNARKLWDGIFDNSDLNFSTNSHQVQFTYFF